MWVRVLRALLCDVLCCALLSCAIYISAVLCCIALHACRYAMCWVVGYGCVVVSPHGLRFECEKAEPNQAVSLVTLAHVALMLGL